MNPRRSVVVVVAVVALVGGCANDEADDDAASTGGEDAAASADGAAEPPEAIDGDGDDPSGAPVLATTETELGTILVDGEGMALYLFDDDVDGTSTCYDDCAVTWPPLVGEAVVDGEADEALVGTTEREGGSLQVTYAGMPLYHYAGDTAPGDTNGQGIGGIWWVVGADGERIADDAPAEPASGGY